MTRNVALGRSGLLAAAGLAAAVGIGAIAIGVAASGGPGAAAAPGVLLASSPSPTPATPNVNPGWGGRGGRGMMGGPGMKGGGWGVAGDDGWAGPGGGRRMGAYGDISITKIDGTKLSLQTTDGWTRTIDAAGATVTRDGQTVALDTLRVGDQIVFGQTRQADGTFKISRVTVVLPRSAGTVSAIDSASLTLTLRDGTSQKIVLTSSTTYRLAGQASTRSAIAVGSAVSATGTVASDGTFTATSVDIMPSVVAGTLKSKTSDTIVLTTRDGSTVTVKVSSTTTYQVAGVTSAALKDVAVGAWVNAQGTRNADGSLSATAVRAMPADWPGGGFGRGHGWDWWGGPNAPAASPPPTPSQG